jgi:hypothetical protein
MDQQAHSMLGAGTDAEITVAPELSTAAHSLVRWQFEHGREVAEMQTSGPHGRIATPKFRSPVPFSCGSWDARRGRPRSEIAGAARAARSPFWLRDDITHNKEMAGAGQERAKQKDLRRGI